MKTKQPTITLSPRETDVLLGVQRGETSWETAKRLQISPRTVETYRERSMRHLGAKNSTQACFRALELGLLKPRPKHDK